MTQNIEIQGWPGREGEWEAETFLQHYPTVLVITNCFCPGSTKRGRTGKRGVGESYLSVVVVVVVVTEPALWHGKGPLSCQSSHAPQAWTRENRKGKGHGAWLQGQLQYPSSSVRGQGVLLPSPKEDVASSGHTGSWPCNC